jgi:hypothetical protein
VRAATDLADGISTSSGEQTHAAKTVSEAMQAIASIVEESAIGAGETTRAVQDLVDMSERLNRAISLFKIDVDTGQGAATGERPVASDALLERLVDVIERHRAPERAAATPEEPPAGSGNQPRPTAAGRRRLLEELRGVLAGLREDNAPEP